LIFDKLIEKVNSIPVEDWKQVETSIYNKGYYTKLLNGYQAVIYREWEVEHGKPEWTGGHAYNLVILNGVGDNFIFHSELGKFRTNKVARLYENIKETDSRECTKKMIKRNKEKRSELSSLISRL